MTDLDRDINELIAWYEAYHGKTYCQADIMPDTLAQQDTKPNGKYPLPNSHNHAAPTTRKTPRLPKPVKHLDRAEYDKRVAELRAQRYILLIDAAIRTGKSKEAIRADMYAGNIKVTNVLEGVTAQGTNLPRYFVHPDDITRYIEWCNAGRPKKR